MMHHDSGLSAPPSTDHDHLASLDATTAAANRAASDAFTPASDAGEAPGVHARSANLIGEPLPAAPRGADQASAFHAATPSASQTTGTEIYDPAATFAGLGLRNSVLKGVAAAGYERPTIIQARLIPLILARRDVLGQAKTGTGKTAAFGLPLIHLAQRDLPFQSLILAPTRELAMQIAAELARLARFTPIGVEAVYGGERISTQTQRLREEPEIIVGTPGRILDLVQRRMLHFRNVRFVVLDEVDRMLDIGFREDMRRILSQCPAERQTIFVSATISPEIERLARQFLRDPVKVAAVAGSLTVSLVRQFYLSVQPWDKPRLLVHLLTREAPALTLVFCRLKRTCDELVAYLRARGIDAHAIHADLPQSRRNAIMEKLRSGKMEVLVASDLASRGLDVEGITHVINYDLPDDAELYVHRIGRTARAGRGGTAWSFVTPDQGALLTQIEKLINAEIPRLDYPDFEPGPVPESAAREQQLREARQAQRASRLSPPVPPTVTSSVAPAGTLLPAGVPQAVIPPLPPTPDPVRFPGGIVPTRLPPKRMQGRVKSHRVR